MIRKPVSSSSLKSVGYNSTEELLEIEFINENIYHYFKIPFAVYSELMTAVSHSSYFSTNIHYNYQYNRLL